MFHPDPFDAVATAFDRLGQRNVAGVRSKTATEREQFVVQCYVAVNGLLSASTIASNLNVDQMSVAMALADLILASPQI